MDTVLLDALRRLIFELAEHGSELVLGLSAIFVFGLGPLGRALAQRLRGARDTSPELLQRLDEVAASLEELHQRAEFTERALAKLPPVMAAARARTPTTPRTPSGAV